MKNICFYLAFILLILLPLNAFANGDSDLELSESDLSESDNLDAEASCLDHEQCPAGFMCDEGECVQLPDGECRKVTDCPYEGMYCDQTSYVCRYYCTEDNQCFDGEYCNKNTYMCEQIPDGDGEFEDFCLNDLDCSPQEYCDLYSRTCEPKCGDNSDCDTDEVCIDQRCEPASPADIDAPWEYSDYDEDEDIFEIPEGYEMPAPQVDGDLNEFMDVTGGSGGVEYADDDKKSVSSCQSTSQNSSTFLLISALLLGLFAIRRRKSDRQTI